MQLQEADSAASHVEPVKASAASQSFPWALGYALSKQTRSGEEEQK